MHGIGCFKHAAHIEARFTTTPKISNQFLVCHYLSRAELTKHVFPACNRTGYKDRALKRFAHRSTSGHATPGRLRTKHSQGVIGRCCKAGIQLVTCFFYAGNGQPVSRHSSNCCGLRVQAPTRGFRDCVPAQVIHQFARSHIAAHQPSLIASPWHASSLPFPSSSALIVGFFFGV